MRVHIPALWDNEDPKLFLGRVLGELWNVNRVRNVLDVSRGCKKRESHAWSRSTETNCLDRLLHERIVQIRLEKLTEFGHGLYPFCLCAQVRAPCVLNRLKVN